MECIDAPCFPVLTKTRCVNDTIVECEVTAPANGALGNCPEKLPSGGVCQFTCDFGFVLTGDTSCLNGALTPGECVRGDSCSVNALPELVAPGDCPLPGVAELVSGASCQPECNDFAPPGSTIGEIRCNNGKVCRSSIRRLFIRIRSI